MPDKVIIQNSRSRDLVGNFSQTSSGKIIIMCHGFTGDKSEWGRFDSAAERFHASGFNVLAFDFSGCGESDDDALTVDQQVDDLQCVIRWVVAHGFSRIGVLGHSLGGLVTSLAFCDDIAAAVYWAPVTDKKLDYAAKFSDEQRLELQSTGRITKIRDVGVRRVIVIDQSMIEARETIDQGSLMRRVTLPIMIVHGNADNVVPLSWSRAALELLPEGSMLEVIDGVGHDFGDKLHRAIELSRFWFISRL